MTTSLRAAALGAAAVILAACAKPAPETEPTPEPSVAAGASRASVCAPTGYLTDNLVTTFGDLFTANDKQSVARRKGMKIAKLSKGSARPAPVADDAVCSRAVRALAPQEPAAARALGSAPKAKGKKAPAPAARPVKPAAGGVLALVKVGPYYLAQDASPRPNNPRPATTYVLDQGMKVKGVFQ